MYGCVILDWMRNCYQYAGEWDFGDGVEPAVIRYYRPSLDDLPQKYRVPYGSHFYAGAGQAEGHAPHPPGYLWVNGANPLPEGVCQACGQGRPYINRFGCVPVVVFVGMEWEGDFGADSFSREATWSETVGKYLPSSDGYTSGPGYTFDPPVYDGLLDAWRWLLFYPGGSHEFVLPYFPDVFPAYQWTGFFDLDGHVQVEKLVVTWL